MLINNIKIQDTSYFASIVSYLRKNKDNKHMTILIFPIKNADFTMLQVIFN